MKKLLLLFPLLLLFSCGKDYTPEQKKYISEIMAHRAEKNHEFRTSESSPFNRDPDAHFEPLKYFDVDPSYVFKSRFTPFAQKDTVTIYGTKGEARKTVKYGYLTFEKDGKVHQLKVYESATKDGQKYYSIWFTDETTNIESYGVGRYLDFTLEADPTFVYTIDFNLAFNPYCSYSKIFSCAIPSKDDYLNLAIRAGEKKFHD